MSGVAGVKGNESMARFFWPESEQDQPAVLKTNAKFVQDARKARRCAPVDASLAAGSAPSGGSSDAADK